MKKNFNIYIVVWALLVALFNVVAFVGVSQLYVEGYTASFWIGYAFITVAFLGQLFCAYLALKAMTAQKLFYNLSLFKTGYAGLIATFVVAAICMLIPALPYWVGIVICAVILVFNMITVIKAKVVIDEVTRIDQKVKVQTFYIKSLTIDADTLMASAKSDTAKAECRKVYEALRYSDPMSNDALASVEAQISTKFAELSDAVNAGKEEEIAALARDVIVLVGDRNKKCKLFK